MDFVALVSGGKDSILALVEAEKNGHRCVCLGHICKTRYFPARLSHRRVFQVFFSSIASLTLLPRPSVAPNPLTAAPPQSTPRDDVNSFMYQSVCSNMVVPMASCMKLPLVLRPSKQLARDTSLQYVGDASRDDEVEDLFVLLSDVKMRFPTVKAVSAGAIFSTYQRCRVESVCSRLRLTALSYLWRVDQSAILGMVRENAIDATLVKVSSAGLDPSR